MKLSLTIVLIFFSNTLWANLDSIISDKIKKKQTIKNTGVAVSVFNANQVILSKGYGYRDRRSKLPVDKKTIFAIGSTTKAFTSLGIGQLVDKGLIKLNDSVKKHLPNFELAGQEVTNKVTITQILSHQTGLPRHDVAWYLTNFSRYEIFDRLKHFDLNPGMEYGKSFQYNNLMYMTAGLIIEKKSGLKWEEYTRRNILNPLEMNDTYLNIGDLEDKTNLAIPYYMDKELEYKTLESVAPAGSIYSNVNDMTKWGQMHLRNGENTRGEKLISSASHNEMFVPRIAINFNKEITDFYYGLGWMLRIKSKRIFHGGNIDGFSALIAFSKKQNIGIIILVNQSGSSLNDEVAKVIFDYFKKENETFNFKSLDINNYPSLPPHLINSNKDLIFSHEFFDTEDKNDLTGTYFHPGYGIINLGYINGKITLSYYFNTWELQKLEHEVYDYYSTAYFSGSEAKIPFKFNRDDNGKVISLGVPFEEALGYDIVFIKQ